MITKRRIKKKEDIKNSTHFESRLAIKLSAIFLPRYIVIECVNIHSVRGETLSVPISWNNVLSDFAFDENDWEFVRGKMATLEKPKQKVRVKWICKEHTRAAHMGNQFIQNFAYMIVLLHSTSIRAHSDPRRKYIMVFFVSAIVVSSKSNEFISI